MRHSESRNKPHIIKITMDKRSALIIITATVALVYSQSTPDINGNHGLPPRDQLLKVINDSFVHVDSDSDGYIERYEFDTIVIVGDSDNDGCMTEDEYVHFSAGTPTIARAIYEHFDVNKTDCLTVDKVSDQYNIMDSDLNGKVTSLEFQDYYINLLSQLFPSTY